MIDLKKYIDNEEEIDPYIDIIINDFEMEM